MEQRAIRFLCATTRTPLGTILLVSFLAEIILSVCLRACLSLAWRVMVVVSGRGSGSRSLTIVEDTTINGTAGYVRSCSDLHGGGCARIRRSCSCGTTGRRICRSRGVSAPHFHPRKSRVCTLTTNLPESLSLSLFPLLYYSIYIECPRFNEPASAGLFNKIGVSFF